VMSNWMKHWGSVGREPVKRDGYTLTYAELDANDIAPSFARNVSGLAPTSMTFFKFCFADFDGSNLSTREKEVEQVIATAKARQLKSGSAGPGGLRAPARMDPDRHWRAGQSR
jgi:hypothetical protein